MTDVIEEASATNVSKCYKWDSSIWSGVPYLCHAHSNVVRRINEKIDQCKSSLPL